MAVNHTLQIDEFAEQPEQIPVHIDYHIYTADQSSRASCSFRIDSPGSGALLDSEAWIKYTLTFTFANDITASMFRVTDDKQSNRGVKLALRQGFPMQRCMQSISLNINGTTLVERPDRYTDQMLRFYVMPDEAETIMTGAGGYLDSGFGWALLDSDNSFLKSSDAENAAVMWTEAFNEGDDAKGVIAQKAVPSSSLFINKGLQKRWEKFLQECRNAGDPEVSATVGNQTAYPDVISIDVWERLPIAPFMNYESRDLKRSIPHINQMTLNINWNPNLHTDKSIGAESMILQGHKGGETGEGTGTVLRNLELTWFTASDPNGKAPELHLKWLIPPMGYRLPPQISIPIIDYQHFSQTLSALTHESDVRTTPSRQETYNNIRLEQFPDYLFIYIVPEQSNSIINDPSEFALEIEALDISADGDSGKLLSATTMELYSMYVRNALGREMIRQDYQQWRQHHCVICLRPEDLGLRFSPGIRQPITLNLRFTYKSHWNRPDMTALKPGSEEQNRADQQENLWGESRSPVINVLCEYRKYRLTLTESGGSRRELLSLPKADLQALPQAVPSQAVGGLDGVF